MRAGTGPGTPRRERPRPRSPPRAAPRVPPPPARCVSGCGQGESRCCCCPVAFVRFFIYLKEQNKTKKAEMKTFQLSSQKKRVRCDFFPPLVPGERWRVLRAECGKGGKGKSRSRGSLRAAPRHAGEGASRPRQPGASASVRACDAAGTRVTRLTSPMCVPGLTLFFFSFLPSLYFFALSLTVLVSAFPIIKPAVFGLVKRLSPVESLDFFLHYFFKEKPFVVKRWVFWSSSPPLSFAHSQLHDISTVCN